MSQTGRFPQHVATTKRPPSSPALEVSEQDRLLGQLMASQARIEAAWNARQSEHETFTRMVTQLSMQVEELTDRTRATHVLLRRLSKLTPALLVLVEAVRVALRAAGHAVP